jgi:hypothetical protein
MASFLDNPEAYIEKSNAEVAEAEKGANKVTNTQAATSAEPTDAPTSQKTGTVKSFLDDPEAYIAQSEQEVQSHTATRPAGGPSQADVLAGATQKVDDNEFINKYGEVLNTLEPEEVVKFQKMQPNRVIPRNVWKRGYDWQKTQPTKILPTRSEIADMIYSKSPDGRESGLVGSIKNMARGVRDIGMDIASTDPEANAKFGTDVKSFLAPMLSIPEEVGWTAAKMAAGGTSLTDYLHNDQDREENAYQRHVVDAARETAAQASHNNIYERFLTSPTAVAGYKALMASQGPSLNDIRSQHPEMTPEQAAAYRDNMYEQQAQEYAQQIAKDQAPLNQNVMELGTWFSPAGLGMGEMGVLMNAGNIAKGLSALKDVQLLGKEGIAAKRAAELAAAQEDLAKGIAAAQKPSFIGKTADQIKDLQQKISEFSEAHPTLSKVGEAAFEYAPAAVLGYEASDHNAGGALAGLAGVALGKRLGLGKLISEAPTVVSDIDKARMMSAGGRVGTLEMAGANPEFSKVTRLLFGGGRGAAADKFINNVVDYGQEGVNMTALGLATGALNSEDPDQMRQTLASGLMYGLGFKTLHKALGADPAAIQRKLRQQDVDNYHRLLETDPNTRQNILNGTDWNNVIQASAQKVNLAQADLDMANASGNAKRIKEATQNLRTAQAIHDKNLTANVQTRQAYGREVLNMFTEGHDLLNGTLRAGQKNAGIAVLTTRQIFDQLKSRPENAAKTDAQLWEAANNLDGVYFHDGGVSYTDRKGPAAQEGQFENLTFDPTKPTVVVNADKVADRMGRFNQSFHEALSHELGHAVSAVPEFRDANAKAEETLFGIQRTDLNGNTQEYKAGMFTPKKLLEMFQDKYLGAKGYSPEDIQQWADNNGMWDRQNKRFDEAKVAAYMKEEILAGLTGANLMPDVKETGLRHILDWASLQAQNNIVASAINKTIGYGGKLPHKMVEDANTGVKFTPQQLAANRDALRQIRKLNGMLSEPVSGTQSAPAISKLELLANKGLWKRYGQDSGLFKTEMRATVYDANGNAVSSTVVADPTAKEGSWSSTNDGWQQDSGYGQLPQGVQVPQGGSVRVSREIVMGPDGQTPQMLTPKEAKNLQDTRTGLIRDALNTAYEGEEGGFRPTSADGLSWAGTFTAKQIQAIRDLPENVVPKSVKDTILRMNQLIAEGSGKRMFIDYAAMMNDNGRYKAFAPKIYEVVPLGMGLSKEGNFYIVTASVTRMNQKLKLWQQRLPGRLSMWNGDADAFFRDFSNIYLKNWQEGRPGETGLDADPKVALQKKAIFADFLNFATKDTAELHDRTTIPRKKGDARDKDPDRIIMSVRADHVRDMLESTNDPLPIDYRKGKFNLLPATKENTEVRNIEPQTQEIDSTIQKAKDVLSKPQNLPTPFKPARINREVGTNQENLSMPDETAAKAALDVSKQPKFGLARGLDSGYPVALRIDIPAFNRTGNYVVTVHEKGTPSKVGEVIGYDNIARVDNPTFVANEKGAAMISSGESRKFPIATVTGEFNPSRDIPEDINDWAPVGFDPKEHSFFYDKANDEMVTGGDEAVSVGNTVFVKNPVYGDRNTARFMPARKGDSPAATLSKEERDAAVKFINKGTLTAANVFDSLSKLPNGDVNSITEKLSTDTLFELAHKATGTPILNRVGAISAIRNEINGRKDAMQQSSIASPMADDIIRTPVNRQASMGVQYKPSTKYSTIEVAPDPKDKSATAAWNKFDEGSKRRVTEQVGNMVLPKVAKAMGLPKPKITHAIGGFQQETNPSMLVQFPESVPYEKQMEYAKVAGHVLKQQAVITFDETNKTDDQGFFVGMTPSRKLTYEETSDLYKKINEVMPEAGGFTGRGEDLIFGNFSELSNDDFYNKIQSSLTEVIKGVDYNLSAVKHQFRSNYLESGTQEALNDTLYGNSNIQGREAGGNPVRRKAGDLDSLQAAATKSVRKSIAQERDRIRRYAITPDAAGVAKLLSDAKAEGEVSGPEFSSEPLLVRSNITKAADGSIKYKDVVEKSVGEEPLVVLPMPNTVISKDNNPLALKNKNVSGLKAGRYQKEIGDRIDAGAARVQQDPEILTSPKGYAEYMRDMGVTGDILIPPSALTMLLKKPEQTLALLKGGYHGDKTVAGTKEAAIQGLDGVMEMRDLLAGQGPTPLVTALHHFWGTLSKQLPPIQQEALWMRLISNPDVMEQIQKSIDGTYDLDDKGWKAIVQKAKSQNQGNYGKFGNNATANANSFHLMLDNHNGKWDQVASVYKNDDSVAMRNEFWGLGHGPTGIKNKVQSFIGLTFGIPSNILDRWRFVSLHLPMLMNMKGTATAPEFFTYSGRNKTVPEDPMGVYKNYGTVENGNVPFSIALYSGLDRAVQQGINNYAPLREYLGRHANPGGFHWIDWNAIKNEAVGHSSLDITKSFLQQYGRDATATDFLNHVKNTSVYTEGENKGKIVRLIMDKGVFRIAAPNE